LGPAAVNGRTNAAQIPEQADCRRALASLAPINEAVALSTG